jgi:hypothetical protein
MVRSIFRVLAHQRALTGRKRAVEEDWQSRDPEIKLDTLAPEIEGDGSSEIAAATVQIEDQVWVLT